MFMLLLTQHSLYVLLNKINYNLIACTLTFYYIFFCKKKIDNNLFNKKKKFKLIGNHYKIVALLFDEISLVN